MTLQIDSPAISADEVRTNDVQTDQLFQEVEELDAELLGAIERRTELMRTLTAATGSPVATDDTQQFEGLGSDGSVISRMLARIASVTR